jgi:hypothetical protein
MVLALFSALATEEGPEGDTDFFSNFDERTDESGNSGTLSIAWTIGRMSASAAGKFRNSSERTDERRNYQMRSERWIKPGTGRADAHYNPAAAP